MLSIGMIRTTLVTIRCKDRPKLLFDTVCTLTDMDYVVFHANIDTEGPDSYQVMPFLLSLLAASHEFGLKVGFVCSNYFAYYILCL